MNFSLNHLSETEFEEFSFDLLRSLDFVNLSWRKGTGSTSSSPSDQGRDIEGRLLKRDFDGTEHHERWFVECKHYLKGVPPEKIQGALAWANAERPDVLLIIVSNFLSNPAKNYLSDYQAQNRPPYRIKVWELKDLENLTAGKSDLRRRYKLSLEVPFIAILNAYHLIYVSKPQLNTMEYFIELMDALDPQRRDEAFSMAYFDIVRSRFQPAVTGQETMAELKIGADDYLSFRSKCLATASDASPNYVQMIVTSALAWMFHFGDKTDIGETRARLERIVENIRIEIKATSDEAHRARLTRMLELPARTLSELPERTERFYALYSYVCDELVRKLLAEKPNFGS